MAERGAKWSYTLDRETCWSTYDTREEAVAAGVEDARAEGRSRVWVGECEFYSPEIDADWLLDNIRDRAYESEFGEHSEFWLSSVTVEEVGELEGALNDAFREWLRRTGNVPQFFICDASEEIAVDAGEGPGRPVSHSVGERADG